MTFVTNKKLGLERAKETTNQKSTNKTRHTSNFTQHWKFIWQSYACIEQDGRAVPMEEKETTFSLKPSRSQIDQLRKYAHVKGFKLVSIQPCCPSPEDEF